MRMKQEEQHIQELDQRLDEVAREFSARTPLDPHRLREIERRLAGVRAAETALVADHRKLAAERARVAEEAARYRALFTEAPEAVIVTDLRGYAIDANRAATELVRRGLREIRDLPIAALLAGDGRAEVPALLERVLREHRIEDVPLRVAGSAARRGVTACVRLVGGSLPAIAWHFGGAAPSGGSDAPGQFERRLRESRAELEYATAARDEFLGLMSHELKTPIAVIAGNAEVLARRDDQLAPEQRRAALADIRAEAARLQRVVDNLLALARLERGQQIGREPVDLAQIIRESLEQHRVEWTGRDFIVEIGADVPLVDAAPAYVSQALRNLITNAEQHTALDQPIEVRAVRHEGGAVITVADRGPDVSDVELDRLTASFAPEPGTVSAYGVSAGVGLAVARRLVEEQHGRLSAERRGDGGMVFAMWLPARERPQSRQA